MSTCPEVTKVYKPPVKALAAFLAFYFPYCLSLFSEMWQNRGGNDSWQNRSGNDSWNRSGNDSWNRSGNDSTLNNSSSSSDASTALSLTNPPIQRLRLDNSLWERSTNSGWNTSSNDSSGLWTSSNTTSEAPRGRATSTPIRGHDDVRVSFGPGLSPIRSRSDESWRSTTHTESTQNISFTSSDLVENKWMNRFQAMICPSGQRRH
ncbi:unnamed protein product [Cylicocyclus nassatus]|uniref:Uncharacterized protein n=1 Tax=Cylicocyclus nassatus TaxID=53992 RepID=A0AA36HGX4_CYLNA|nr:unnamed protein product [Cylicocyclus nassatus]